jgi:hypothetical protein
MKSTILDQATAWLEDSTHLIDTTTDKERRAFFVWLSGLVLAMQPKLTSTARVERAEAQHALMVLVPLRRHLSQMLYSKNDRQCELVARFLLSFVVQSRKSILLSEMHCKGHPRSRSTLWPKASRNLALTIAQEFGQFFAPLPADFLTQDGNMVELSRTRMQIAFLGEREALKQRMLKEMDLSVQEQALVNRIF